MKKVALIVSLLMISQASFAYIQEYTTSDVKTLQGTGLSQETIRMVETARVLKQGVEKDYVPFYERTYYSNNPIRKWYQVVKRFWDPATDNHTFGVGEITFENGMFDLSPSYSSRMAPNDKYNRLFDEDIKRLETSGKTIKGSGGVEPSYNSYQQNNVENL